MSKVNVKIIIGSNYGDECKGLATHFFSKQAAEKNQKCINILYNGGCQRGHTVDLNNRTRHIFHHFGSGTFDNAHTYFDKDFMINPMIFIKEYDELLNSDEVRPICFISPECRVTTPYDMFINQIVETYRDNNRHGSCGFGIWETEQRYKNNKYNLRYAELINMTDNELFRYLKEISSLYLEKQLESYCINAIPQEYIELINSDNLLKHYISDLRSMQKIVIELDYDKLFTNYDTIIFEGAQGLELDADNINAYPYVTASNTTSKTPIDRVKNIDCNVEICYITRSYFTRHGAGNFPTECNKDCINSKIIDNTNINNEFQKSIRYGLFSKDEFLHRVLKDINESKIINQNITTSVFISHLNYTNNEIYGDCTISSIVEYFDKHYLSSNKYIL